MNWRCEDGGILRGRRRRGGRKSEVEEEVEERDVVGR